MDSFLFVRILTRGLEMLIVWSFRRFDLRKAFFHPTKKRFDRFTGSSN
jgi:hypothetical protein